MQIKGKRNPSLPLPLGWRDSCPGLEITPVVGYARRRPECTCIFYLLIVYVQLTYPGICPGYIHVYILHVLYIDQNA